MRYIDDTRSNRLWPKEPAENTSVSVLNIMRKRVERSANLANADPQVRFLDICRRLIVPAEESYGWGGSGRFGSLVELREYGQDVGRLINVRWVRRWADNDEVVTKCVVAWRLCNPLLNRNILCGGAISNAHVDNAVFEILDADGGVALVPCYLEMFAAVLDTPLDERVGKGYHSPACQRGVPFRIVGLSRYL